MDKCFQVTLLHCSWMVSQMLQQRRRHLWSIASIESFGGKLTKLDNWGRRRLAYPIQKNNRGLFVYTKYLGAGGVVAEIERNLRITDSVLRQQTIVLRRDLKASDVDLSEKVIALVKSFAEDPEKAHPEGEGFKTKCEFCGTQYDIAPEEL